MKKQAQVAVVAALIAIIPTVAGCSTEVTGKPSATPISSGSQSTPATSSQPSEQSAPRVSKPLDITKFTSSPCSALTNEQISGFKVTGPGEPDQGNDGTSCIWNIGSDHSTSISVLFTTAVTNGLSNTYNLNSAGIYKDGYFEPTKVEDYPGVFNDVADTRPGGACHLLVGASDQRIFGVLVQGRTGTDGCKAATNVAKAVLQTIQKGQ